MNTVTFMGNPLHLEGNLPVVGQKAPEFTVCNNGLEPRSLKDYEGKIVVLVSVPSLDTPVCDMEVRRFNKEAAALSDKVQILALSCDLPFAQARWCGAAGVQAVESLSDYKDVDFGKNYGVLIAGVLCGLFGVGALLAAYVSRVTDNGSGFKANISMVFLVESTFRIGLYIALKILTMEIFCHTLMLFPFSLLGLWIGMKCSSKMDDRIIKRLIVILLIVSGISLIATNL